MLQQVTAATGASHWAIASLLFFIVVFAGIAIRVLRAPKSHYDHLAHLPLEEDTPAKNAANSLASTAHVSGRES